MRGSKVVIVVLGLAASASCGQNGPGPRQDEQSVAQAVPRPENISPVMWSQITSHVREAFSERIVSVKTYPIPVEGCVTPSGDNPAAYVPETLDELIDDVVGAMDSMFCGVIVTTVDDANCRYLRVETEAPGLSIVDLGRMSDCQGW